MNDDEQIVMNDDEQIVMNDDNQIVMNDEQQSIQSLSENTNDNSDKLISDFGLEI